MNKNQYNAQCAELIDESMITFDMLIQAYSQLDKKVSKYAYLKKKWSNDRISHDGYLHDFTQVIQKRNTIERVLRTEFLLSVDDIKCKAKDTEVIITQKNCDSLVDMIKGNSFEIVTER